MDFRERFGLSWKEKVAQSSESSTTAQRSDIQNENAAPEGLNEAVVFYSRPFLETLKRAPNKRARLFDVARDISVRVDVVIPVERYLVTNGYVTRIEEDKLGND